ncbi:MAG TPA: DUF1080 domain-containing protein [Puia sp.]|nr:DUF1080 domain-containing protein [Puia sp.]
MRYILLLVLWLLHGYPDIKAQPGPEKPGSWEVLFDGRNTDKWVGINGNRGPSGGWVVKDGTLCVKEHAKGQDIITKETYGNFELVFDFKLTYGANSGIKYLVDEIRNNSTGKKEWNGMEYQIIDDYNHPEVKDHKHEKGSTASLYLCYAPEHKQLHPAGEWNTGRIIVKGSHIEHWLNGVKVVSCERGTADFRQRMAATKFNVYDKYGELPQGHIMLTDHDGDACYFRSIKVRRLN